MKKFKFILPVLAFALAITGVFALSSSTAIDSEEEVVTLAITNAFDEVHSCDQCTVPASDNCGPGDGIRCVCQEQGGEAALTVEGNCDTPLYKNQGF